MCLHQKIKIHPKVTTFILSPCFKNLLESLLTMIPIVMVCFSRLILMILTNLYTVILVMFFSTSIAILMVCISLSIVIRIMFRSLSIVMVMSEVPRALVVAKIEALRRSIIYKQKLRFLIFFARKNPHNIL